MSWYSLRVISGKEQATKENILREAEENSIEQDIEEVFYLMKKLLKLEIIKKSQRKMFFPGYILINMQMNNNSKYIVENTPGVLGLLDQKDRSSPTKR